MFAFSFGVLFGLECFPPLQSETLQINPLHTLIPATMCVSFGVMLPVGNPPNAIVFSYGHVRISDMVRRGTFYGYAKLLILSDRALCVCAC